MSDDQQVKKETAATVKLEDLKLVGVTFRNFKDATAKIYRDSSHLKTYNFGEEHRYLKGIYIGFFTAPGNDYDEASIMVYEYDSIEEAERAIGHPDLKDGNGAFKF